MAHCDVSSLNQVRTFLHNNDDDTGLLLLYGERNNYDVTIPNQFLHIDFLVLLKWYNKGENRGTKKSLFTAMVVQ